MKELLSDELGFLDDDAREDYNKVTNSGVICHKCNKPVASSVYIKIFKVKNYLPENGFAECESIATLENSKI